MSIGDAQGGAVVAVEARRGTWPGFGRWWLEGLRAALFLRPRVGGDQPTPGQVAAITLSLALLYGLLWRAEIQGPATINPRGWLVQWWNAAGLLWLAWWALSSGARLTRLDPRTPTGVATWFVLCVVSAVPANILSWATYLAQTREWLSADGWWPWLPYLMAPFWSWLAMLVLTRRFGVGHARLSAVALGWIALVIGSTSFTNDRYWWPDRSQKAADDEPRLIVSQEAFERQQAIWRDAVAALLPERAGVRDVYGLVFAPYASEDVFLRESGMVAGVLQDRFDARGRVLHLVNHARTQDSLPWATLLNLERGIQAIAQRMDRERDVFVLYMTSHGASNFRLAAEHWPLEVNDLSPAALKDMLEQAGIRNRVIAISACYSGGWIEPLAGDHTLIMTAAHAERTSYGCGRKSELTYFGRAVFDEELRRTHSFEQAFHAARPVIEEREKVVRKKDGYSDPQIRVGAGIQPALRELEQRLERQGALVVHAGAASTP